MSEERQRTGFQINKNHKIYDGVEEGDGGKTIEWGVTTNGGPERNVNSILMFDDGDKAETVRRTSMEVTGCGKKGTMCKEGEPSKLIYAQSGDIHIEAVNGSIVLKAKNIRIVATDGSGEITLESGKILEFKAPVTNVKGTNVNITGSSKVTTLGQFVENSASVQASTTSLVDIAQGSFLGKILGAIGSLKKFLNIFGD
jgi:hypothetical protein